MERQKKEIKEEILEGVETNNTKLLSAFYDKIDPILKEVLVSRDERPLMENRLEALEEIHHQGKHSIASS